MMTTWMCAWRHKYMALSLCFDNAHMSSSLWFNPHHCDLIDLLKSEISDFLSLGASAGTRSQHTDWHSLSDTAQMSLCSSYIFWRFVQLWHMQILDVLAQGWCQNMLTIQACQRLIKFHSQLAGWLGSRLQVFSLEKCIAIWSWSPAPYPSPDIVQCYKLSYTIYIRCLKFYKYLRRFIYEITFWLCRMLYLAYLANAAVFNAAI